MLRGETLVSPQDLLTTAHTSPHGHVEAILAMIRRLGLETVIASKRCRERDLVVAMIVQRLIDPCSKLATTRAWHTTTLAEELGVAEATEDELYAAMDWLLARQERIEKKLAARHLTEGGLVLYDVTSSSYEGRTCPLAHFGHNRDGDKLPIIVYGVMTDGEGRPVGVEVYPGNTGDPTTVGDQVEKVRQRFGLERVVLVGDRGMLTPPQIDKLRERPGLGWITALTSGAIRKLVEKGALQLSLLDEKNLAEITSPDYPGERLVVCHNPLLEEERARKRQALLEATEKSLTKIAKDVARRKKKLLTAAEIGLKVGKVLGRYKVGKHFDCQHRRGQFHLESPPGSHRAGSQAGRDLRAAHQRTCRAPLRRRHRAELQKPGGSRAGVSLSEGPRPVGAADSASHRGAGARAYFPLPAGLLRGMASAPRLGAAVVRGRRAEGANGSDAIRFCPPSPPPPPRPRNARIKPPRGFRCTASAPCSRSWPAGPE